MGKVKKVRRGARGDVSDSEGEPETQEQIDKVAPKKTKAAGKKALEIDENIEHIVEKKKGKHQSKKVQSEEDDASGDEVHKQPEKSKGKKGKEKKKVTPDDSDGEVEFVEKKPTKKSAKKNNKKKDVSDDDDDDDDGEINVPVTKMAKSFALLQVDSESDDVSDEKDQDDDSESEVKPVKKDSSKKKGNSDSNKFENSDNRTKEGGGKKSKKNRRKKDDSDEDIDKVLAELEMEYSGVKKDEPVVKVDDKKEVEEETGEKQGKSKKKSKKGTDKVEETKLEDDVDKDAPSEETSTVKTAAQKKKEKKEREKLKKKQDQQEPSKTEQVKLVEEEPPREKKEPTPEQQPVNEPADETEKDGKKKKKKGAKTEEKEPKKGLGKKTIAAMQEALVKMREQEERLKREEEERLKREEEVEEARLEALRLEKERKEKKKQKEKERKERLKAEGKLLSAKQKADRARAQAMIDSLKAQGMELPDVGERKARLGTRIKPSKVNKAKSQEKTDETAIREETAKIEDTKSEDKVEEQPIEKESDDDVKDAWDASSSEGEEEESEETSSTRDNKKVEADQVDAKVDAEDDEDEDTSASESESEEEEGEENERRTEAEKRRERALVRIEQRKIEAEKNKSLDNLRAAVVCVLGHVDTGKTKILDKLRRTNVQDGEAGGITQQIGATNVPIDAIKENIKYVKNFSQMLFKLPGLLIIDTPGHESFSNLRSRGSSLCDIAILVVDIMHGLEPQTIESINLLKAKKTPFIVALNKIDRLYDWQTINRKDISDIIKNQAANTQLEFEQRKNEVVLQFAEQGLNAALSYENPDERSYVSLVPTSAITGEGMGNLLSLIVENCQNRLTKRLMFSEDLQTTVLEVKAISGLGTTIDAILINGTLREGDTIVLAGTDGPITTQIRSLLMPQPMKELRVKNAYVEFKSIQAAQGVKLAAKELEKAIAGLNLYVAQHPDEVDILRDIVAKELKSALSSIKLQERGVYVQASTLGSLEALLEFLRTSKIPYSGIRIGPVVKKDVMKASTMLEHDSQYATILAFDVKIERDAQELADNLGVKIFQADIIYHLFDKFMAYREELKQKKREEFKNIAVFPCKLRILPQFVFNSRDPIVVGVMVEGGIVKEGTPVCVPSKEFLDVGIVTGIEINHKNVESARKGMEVCVKIEPIPGESPKMFGRHFDETDFLISKISRQSIDACKDYFRDDLTKTDWQLMVELKKLFQIL